MQVTIEKDQLVIRLPLTEPRPSSTGKTLIVASSGGVVRTAATVNGKPVSVGVNAFIAKG